MAFLLEDVYLAERQAAGWHVWQFVAIQNHYLTEPIGQRMSGR
jgi:hypothetical protein